jgi:SAM-dependent methyltransferase
MTRSISEAQRWENGSGQDPIRNDFVVPVLVRLIAAERPRTILDVGAGTGYVARRIDSRLGFRPEWTLIDLNSERLQLAERCRPPEMALECLVGNVFDWPWEVGRFDAVLITFTLLEIEDIDRLCNLISEHTDEGALLAVTMPDAWIDVLEHAVEDAGIVRRYVEGPVEIPKLDKFTGERYPFKATRIEDLLARVLKTGFSLVELEHGRIGAQSAFVFAFRRQAMS